MEEPEVMETGQLEPTGEVETPAEDIQAAEPTESAPVEVPSAEESAAPAEVMPEKVQKRIDEVIWQLEEARREKEYWKMQAEKRLAQPIESPPEPVAVAPVTPPPRSEDFETYEAYDEALFDWRYQQRVQKEAQAHQATQRKQAEQAYVEKLDAWTESGAEKYPDFRSVVMKQPHEGGPTITPDMAGAIQDSPAGHDLAYYLGKNPKEALRIAKLSPVAQVREIGALQIKVQAPAQKSTTNAPTPTKPVGGKTAPNVKPEDMTYEEYRNYRITQMKAARGS